MTCWPSSDTPILSFARVAGYSSSSMPTITRGLWPFSAIVLSLHPHAPFAVWPVQADDFISLIIAILPIPCLSARSRSSRLLADVQVS
jgi:hypothetical protein